MIEEKVLNISYLAFVHCLHFFHNSELSVYFLIVKSSQLFRLYKLVLGGRGVWFQQRHVSMAHGFVPQVSSDRLLNASASTKQVGVAVSRALGFQSHWL